MVVRGGRSRRLTLDLLSSQSIWRDLLRAADVEARFRPYFGSMKVKILDGATYSIIKRAPKSGQWDYVWVGDNGREIELTEEEAAQLRQEL